MEAGAQAVQAQPNVEPVPGLFFPHSVNNDRDSIISNIRTNSRRGIPDLRQHEVTDVPLAIVAGGPSLADYLEILRAVVANGGCHVLSVNGAYKHLRGLGIESDHFLLVDSRRDNLCHVDSPHKDTNHILASQVHPAVYESLGDHRITMFHPGTDTAMEVFKDEPGKEYLTAPIGMASVHAVYVAAALGYRNIMLFGYDFSHKGQESYAFDQPMNRSDEALEVDLQGQKYRTTLTLARTAQQFVRAVSPVIRGCELNIRMFSNGLLPDMLKAALATSDEDSERAKYEQIWGVEAYRRISPGLSYAAEALELLKLPAYSVRIADFGCGTGRAAKWFEDQGHDAIGVDIARSALEEDIPFVQCALWDAEKLPQVDYGFSCDVLEHIPTDKVRDTLQAIHDSVRVACYLNIDTVDDSFGVLIGQPLHLTVMPAESWERLLKEIWREVEQIPTTNKQAIFVCRK